MNYRLALVLAPAVASLALAACKDDRGPPPSEEGDAQKRSIFRPEFQVEPIEALDPQGSLETRVQFPEGSELTEEARADLATVLASPQIAEGGAIVLRGHSDSGGSDEVNMRVSQERAEAVREWLVENGVAEDRITVIAFGEQNPDRPNALPDGSPDEVGRAANRRVEIEIRGKAATPQKKEPTLAESLAEAAAEGEAEPDEPAQ
ncbi:OmpA family protein [Qipengyuania mesophila]|uniref:OmpA family protein n=1 Tax=Qipengyuania mesophila TaxID=2867246 RepID=UPI003510DA13